MTEPSSLDPQALDRLRDWGGAKLVQQMIRLYMENSSGRMDQIRSAVGGPDLGEGGKGAHSLKSSSANLGAEEVRKLCAEMERLADDGDRSGFEALMPRLEVAYTRACTELSAIEEGMES